MFFILCFLCITLRVSSCMKIDVNSATVREWDNANNSGKLYIYFIYFIIIRNNIYSLKFPERLTTFVYRFSGRPRSYFVQEIKNLNTKYFLVLYDFPNKRGKLL